MTGALLVLALAVAQPAPRQPAPPQPPEPPPSAAPPRPPDAWVAPDKVRHFFVAGFVQSLGYSAAVRAGADRRGALAAASVGTAAVSVAKEVRDRRAGGRFSVRDLVWDALGAAAYSALLVRTATR